MGVDVCYTNHAEADQDDMDTLLTLLGVAGAAFVITVPGADDVMLGYQSLSFHDALYARRTLGLRPAPEFEAWLRRVGMVDDAGRADSLRSGALTAARAAYPGAGMTGRIPRSGSSGTTLRKTTQARIGLGPRRGFAAHPRGPRVRRRPRRGPRRRAHPARRRAGLPALFGGRASANRWS